MFTFRLPPPIICYILYLLTSITNAILVNVTVDDSLPDPLTGQLITYHPTTLWNVGQNCTSCTAVLDGASMYDRTWHDGTYYPADSNLPPSGPSNLTFLFNGTAIYVFCALALSTSSPTGYSNMTFYIDGELVGQFEKIPPGIQGKYLYNKTVYSNTNLPPGQHAFTLQNGQPGNAGNKSLTLFDYLVYSYDNGVLAPTPNSNSTKANTQTSTSSSFSFENGESSSTSTKVSTQMSTPTSIPSSFSPENGESAPTSTKASTQMSTSSSLSSSTNDASRQSISAGAITGSVVGGTIGMIIIGLLIFYFRKHRKSRTIAGIVHPFIMHVGNLQRERDADRVRLGRRHDEETLPPEYSNVLPGSDSSITAIPVTLTTSSNR